MTSGVQILWQEILWCLKFFLVLPILRSICNQQRFSSHNSKPILTESRKIWKCSINTTGRLSHWDRPAYPVGLVTTDGVSEVVRDISLSKEVWSIFNPIQILNRQIWQNEFACWLRQARHPVSLVTALGVLMLFSVVRNISLLHIPDIFQIQIPDIFQIYSRCIFQIYSRCIFHPI